MSPFRTIFATAELLGKERYVELALFKALGERALGVTEPDAMLMLASVARSHAWRARVIEELLPVSLGLPGVEEATRSPGASIDEVIGLVCAEGDGAEILDVLGRVLYPEMLSAYRSHLVTCSPAADLPVTVALRRVIGDLECRLDEMHEVIEIDDGPLRARSAAAFELLSSFGGPFGLLQ